MTLISNLIAAFISFSQYERPVSSGSVTFDTDPSETPVHKPLHKLSAKIQVGLTVVLRQVSSSVALVYALCFVLASKTFAGLGVFRLYRFC